MEANIDDCLNTINPTANAYECVCVREYGWEWVDLIESKATAIIAVFNEAYFLLHLILFLCLSFSLSPVTVVHSEVLNKSSNIWPLCECGEWYSLNWFIRIRNMPIDQLMMHMLCDFEKKSTPTRTILGSSCYTKCNTTITASERSHLRQTHPNWYVISCHWFKKWVKASEHDSMKCETFFARVHILLFGIYVVFC